MFFLSYIHLGTIVACETLPLSSGRRGVEKREGYWGVGGTKGTRASIMNISESWLLNNFVEKKTFCSQRWLYTVQTNKNIYTFYNRWIIIDDFHIPVKKPTKALKKKRSWNCFNCHRCHDTVCCFNLWTLFHSNTETDKNLLIVQKKLAVEIRCTGFNMIVQNRTNK